MNVPWARLALSLDRRDLSEGAPGGRIASVAVTLTVGVNTDGRREVPGMASGASEAEAFWTDFLRGLLRRGLQGGKLVISDAHEGIKAAVSRVLSTTWQRCRIHFRRTPWPMRARTTAAWSQPLSPPPSPNPINRPPKALWNVVAEHMRVSCPGPRPSWSLPGRMCWLK